VAVEVIEPINCEDAGPSVPILWPPNGRFVDVAVEGVTSTGDGPVAIAITGITQDEPVGRDADAGGIGTATARPRAERDGAGDGRVYHVFFSASGARGGSCTGEVTVGVPHDRGGSSAGGGGGLFDSTAP